MTIASEAPYRALGFPFVVRSYLPESRRFLGHLLSGFLIEATPSSATVFELIGSTDDGHSVDLRIDDALSVRAVDAGSAIDHLIAEVTTRALRSDHEYVAVHAGVVSHHGAGVLIPGPPGSGKSTLTCALVRSGSGFLSDEVSLLEPGSSWVHPFPRPVALSPASMDLLGLAPSQAAVRFRHFECHLVADDLRLGSASGPTEVDLIVVPQLAPARPASAERLNGGEALQLLMEQCFDIVRLGGSAVKALGELVRGAQCFRLRVGDLPSAVEAVENLLAGR